MDDNQPTEEDFIRTVNEYMTWKLFKDCPLPFSGQQLKGISDAATERMIARRKKSKTDE